MPQDRPIEEPVGIRNHADAKDPAVGTHDASTFS
jgi:hypothetical protein